MTVLSLFKDILLFIYLVIFFKENKHLLLFIATSSLLQSYKLLSNTVTSLEVFFIWTCLYFMHICNYFFDQDHFFFKMLSGVARTNSMPAGSTQNVSVTTHTMTHPKKEQPYKKTLKILLKSVIRMLRYSTLQLWTSSSVVKKEGLSSI